MLFSISRVLGVRPDASAPLPMDHLFDGKHGGERILLVEDNVVNQRVASGLLTRRGHKVTVVSDGREALAVLDRNAFDVVLMDLQMPVMGGIDATAAIRERERQSGGHMRIVAMTAHAMSGDRERCLAAGMDGYLSKPIDPRLLFASVEQISSVVEAAPETAPDETSASVAFDEASLRARVADDEDLLFEVVRMFLEDCPKRLQDIKAAVDARDSGAVRQTSHALKGAAGNLSAMGLFEAARALERAGVDGDHDAADRAWSALSREAAAVMRDLERFESRRHRAA
jgi:CheY-like chemotaxis protein/HPt (histidine-containing phosphotransfer) domain-containing protein